MGKPIDITRLDFSAEELRKFAAKVRDGRVVRRLLGISFLLEGRSREAAARASGMDRQTLRDWVHRYNAEGVAGLHPRPSPGRPSRLSPNFRRSYTLRTWYCGLSSGGEDSWLYACHSHATAFGCYN
jgi:hypothetical protein